MVNGIETTNNNEIKYAAAFLNALMGKRVNHEKGDAIRSLIKSISSDYRIPTSKKDNNEFTDVITEEKKAIFIGKEFRELEKYSKKLIKNWTKGKISTFVISDLSKQKAAEMIAQNGDKTVNRGLIINLTKDSNDKLQLVNVNYQL